MNTVTSTIIFTYALIAASCQSLDSNTGQESKSTSAQVDKPVPDEPRFWIYRTLQNRSNPKDIISDTIARAAHIAYLQSANAIRVKDTTNILRSVVISRSDLEILYNHGTHGARIYFCLENEGRNTFFSLALTPVNSSGQNTLRAPDSSFTIINKVDPCPDYCPKNGIYRSRTDLNYEPSINRWYDPNIRTGSQWVDSVYEIHPRPEKPRKTSQ
jgi:hypothetical protein